MVHNNFASFVNRVEGSFHMEGTRWTFSARLDVYEGELQTLLNTSLWVIRVMSRALQLLAVSFDLPACDWHGRLEQLYDRAEKLRADLEPLLNPDYQVPA